MGENEGLPATSWVLLTLRLASGISRSELARRLGHANDKLLGRYERGEALSREQLDEMVAPLGHPPEAVDVLLFAHELIWPEAPDDPASPVALTPEERKEIAGTAMTVGWTMAEWVLRDLSRRKREEKAAAARHEAEELFQRLLDAAKEERRPLVAGSPEFWSWALVERVCEASVRAAAHKTEPALELADLALFIAERVEGSEALRARAYGWGFIANARRVANDFDGADRDYARALDLWQDSDDALLPAWRLLSLGASLRREQHRFSEALDFLDQARAASQGNREATLRLLLKKEHVYEQMGNFEAALAVLAEATPLLEDTTETRLLAVHHFNTVDNLCHLERYAEAEGLLPKVRELAEQERSELDLVRVLWVESRAHAGLGRKQQAMAGLEQVQRDFTQLRLPYDAALSSLDLAALWLEDGRTAEVKELALSMAWIFRQKKIDRGALAALLLFCDAAKQEAATVELVRQVRSEVEKARRSAPRREQPRGRG